MFQSYLSDILHAVAQWLLMPDIILLLAFIGYALFCIGSLIAECLTERRHFKVVMPKFLSDLMEASEEDVPKIVEESGLLNRHKKALLTVYEHRSLPGDALIALIKREVSEEETRYDRIVGRNSTAARVAPMLGLMGTLIPLGPGIEALGRADTAALSSSLLVAFDTTVAGLVVAAVCLVVGKIRSNWYEDYTSAIDAAMATLLEKIESMRADPEKANAAAVAPAVPFAVPAAVSSAAVAASTVVATPKREYRSAADLKLDPALAPQTEAKQAEKKAEMSQPAADQNRVSDFEKLLEFEPMPEFNPQSKPVLDVKPELESESKLESKFQPESAFTFEPELQPELKPEATPEPQPESVAERQPVQNADPVPAAAAEPVGTAEEEASRSNVAEPDAQPLPEPKKLTNLIFEPLKDPLSRRADVDR